MGTGTFSNSCPEGRHVIHESFSCGLVVTVQKIFLRTEWAFPGSSSRPYTQNNLRACQSTCTVTHKSVHHVGIHFLKSEHHPDSWITWPFGTVVQLHSRWCLPPGPGCRTSKEAAAQLLSLPLSFWTKTIMLMRAMGPGQPTLASAGQL